MSKRAILALLSAFAFSNAFAGNWSQPTTIIGYYVYDDSTAYIRTPSFQNPDNCPSYGYTAINSSAPNFKAIWAQVMTAQITGTTVSLRLQGCLNGYPLVIAIAIPDVW